MPYVSVLLEVSISKPLDYAIPEELIPYVKRGVCVEVPLRGRAQRGFVLEVKDTCDVKDPKSLIRCISTGEVITEELFTLALWMARYYVCPLGKVLKTLLPAGVRKSTELKVQYFVSLAKTKKEIREACVALRSRAPQQAHILEVLLLSPEGLFLSDLLEKSNASASSASSLAEKGLLYLKRVRQDALTLTDEEYFKTKPKTLRHEQQEALGKIVSSLEDRCFQTHLLFGITGSGKTEIYLQAIDKALKMDRGVIMLVPEISLTPQTIQHFRSRFDTPVAVLHHRLSDGERKNWWDQLRDGKCKICLGARSAIFCPMPNVGLIIVDEEHEQSYKQNEESPCYSGRDVAIMRAKITSATVILGSATPSIESFYHAQNGKYTLSILKSRPEGAHLPSITLVDMKREYEKAKGITLFSDLLLKKIEERKAKGEQSILFLNRRGYHTLLSCTACGKAVGCPHCDTSLTFHKSSQILMCHLCGETSSPPKRCPSCHTGEVMKYQGVGTEKIEAMLRGIFPGTTTVRIDADTTRHKGSMQKLMQEFRSGKAEVLIGTQMIAKGLHFPSVTLVGVLNADSTMQIPDFRSQEHAFQLITQVAGRAGRGHAPGEVIIQTSLPDHPTILQAKEQDYETFYREEISVRKNFGFPPFCKIVKFLFSGKEEPKVAQFAETFAEALQKRLPATFFVHPAVAAGHAKVKELYRYQFLVRGPAVQQIVQAISEVDKELTLPSSLFRFIDVDPSSTFF